ncbi:MAG: ceramidase domain-containing protein [Steroidobacteraceae bacterium]|nr:ceramidase domain-containing protein [Steroidobacteraceae bacterium]
MNWRQALLLAVAAAAVVVAFVAERIPQDLAYHAFRDGRTMLGIPNFWNVATNLPFLAVGVAGLLHVREASLPRHFVVFCVGVALVAIGSGWYHLAPSNPALVFDRLPMTIAFMALFAAVVADRVSLPLGQALLWPCVALGIASIGWWHWTETAGDGDLRPYALVQFLPMLLIPAMLVLYRSELLKTSLIWAALGAYVLAKVAEYFDGAVYALGGLVSGHSIKHLLAALAAWWLLRAFLKGTRPIKEP